MVYGDYPDLSRVRKILVVKLRHLGDVLLTGPVFDALKNAMPQATIDAYIYEEAKPMLEGHRAISALLGYDRKWKNLGIVARWRKEFGVLWQIRKGRYDLVLNLTEGDRGILCAKIAGAEIRVGFNPKGRWKKKLYTHVVKHCPGVRHMVERNLDVVRRIGIFPDERERELFLHVSDKDIHFMQKKIGPESFVLIHPTSRWRFKCWPVAKMRELIEVLMKRGKKIVLTSGPDPIEQEMVADIAKGLNVHVLAGKISLKELSALIFMSEVLVCVDSVPLHIASALKKPVVAIFGPTSDVTWGPWRNSKARIVSQNFSCRPCYQDGCGGSKFSDCLYRLPVQVVVDTMNSVININKTSLVCI